MVSPSPPPDATPPLPRVAPHSAWERSVLGPPTLDSFPATDGSGATGFSDDIKREHAASPFIGASRIFLRAGATTTALVSAQQAYVVAKDCCRPCVATTLKLQAQVHQALSVELADQAGKVSVGNERVDTFDDVGRPADLEIRAGFGTR